MSLCDRRYTLEAQTASKHDPLTKRDRQQVGRRPEIMLKRCCEGRLNALAARSDTPVIGKMLRDLAADGYAIQIEGHWHPLFTGRDEKVNRRVLAQLAGLEQGHVNHAPE